MISLFSVHAISVVMSSVTIDYTVKLVKILNCVLYYLLVSLLSLFCHSCSGHSPC